MINIRAHGYSHLYLTTKDKEYSDLAIGLLMRSLGHNLKVAYIDSSGQARKFINFLENLSLSNNFVKSFNKLHLETFTFRKDKKILRSIIPLVEFHTINSDRFWKELKNFDVILFDTIDSNNLPLEKISGLIRNKAIETEIVCICNNEKDFTFLEEAVEFSYKISKTTKNALGGNKNINIYEGDLKSINLISHGHLIKHYLDKKDVKLISFDKENLKYGENTFFKALKQWDKVNRLYGSFDYVSTGVPHNGERKDLMKESNEGLTLLTTALKKQTPIVAEQIGNIIKSDLIDSDKTKKLIEKTEKELVLTGEKFPEEISAIGANHLLVERNKKNRDLQLKKGLDM